LYGLFSHIFISNTVGDVYLFQTNYQRLVGKLKGILLLFIKKAKGFVSVGLKIIRVYLCFLGAAGAVTAICCHPSLPLIATCGLDRYVRIYNYEDRSLYHKIYVKQRMTAILFSKDEGGYQATSNGPTISSHRAENEAIADDDVWATMESVDDDLPKKKPKHT
jgi:ribosome biogenesis protein NSA1